MANETNPTTPAKTGDGKEMFEPGERIFINYHTLAAHSYATEPPSLPAHFIEVVPASKLRETEEALAVEHKRYLDEADSAQKVREETCKSFREQLTEAKARAEKAEANIRDLIDGKFKLDVQYAVEAKLLAAQEESRALREALKNLSNEIQVFLDVSQKIHFPDAREAQAKARETLASVSDWKNDMNDLRLPK